MGRKSASGKRSRSKRFKRRTIPGAVPGSVVADPSAPKPMLRVLSYGPDGFEEQTLDGLQGLDELILRSRRLGLRAAPQESSRICEGVSRVVVMFLLRLEQGRHRLVR